MLKAASRLAGTTSASEMPRLMPRDKCAASPWDRDLTGTLNPGRPGGRSDAVGRLKPRVSGISGTTLSWQ